MIALLQRVAQARVEIAGEVVGQIGAGLLVLLCAEPDDTEAMDGCARVRGGCEKGEDMRHETG